MLRYSISYFKFLYHSKNQHGVHSPFVFQLLTKCLYDKTKYPEYFMLRHYRNQLLQNSEIIEVTDFGAGSRVFKDHRRAVNQIAKNAGITTKRAQLLFRLVRYFQPNSILEIGTSLGLATSALALGNTNAKITTLEGCPSTLAIAKKQFQDSRYSFAVENSNFINTEFSDYFKNLQATTYNFIYFDGNHSKKATLEYVNYLLPTVTNDSVWIFDDIHWSKDMEEAWEAIKNNPKITVTIDTFQWGIVFFRKEQEKEHFILRV